MTVQAYIVMTPSEKDAAVLLDGLNGIFLGPQEITNSLANNLGFGTLVGQWVSPARLLNDPEYERWVSTLGTLPIHVMDSETLFPPPSTDV